MKRAARSLVEAELSTPPAPPAFVLDASECISTVVPSVTAVVSGTRGDDRLVIEVTATRDSDDAVHLDFTAESGRPGASTSTCKLNIPLALFPHLAAVINELYWRSAETRLLEDRAPWYDSTREFDVHADIIAVKP